MLNTYCAGCACCKLYGYLVSALPCGNVAAGYCPVVGTTCYCGYTIGIAVVAAGVVCACNGRRKSASVGVTNTQAIAKASYPNFGEVVGVVEYALGLPEWIRAN